MGICIVLQLVLFVTRYTNVFQAGDLWNNYSYMAWGSMLYILTGNLVMSIVLMILLQLYTGDEEDDDGDDDDRAEGVKECFDDGHTVYTPLL